MEKNYHHFIELINTSQTIMLTTHTHPDADGIGALIALGLALKHQGKKVFCVTEESIHERYQYLYQNIRAFSSSEFLSLNQKVDLVIVVDTHLIDRIGEKMKEVAINANKIFYIDHHPMTEERENQIVNPSFAATCELVGDMILKMKIKFNKQMAIALYSGILIDTSSFRYPSVSSKTHELVSKLLKSGINSQDAYNYIYGTKKINHMKFLGLTLSNSQTTSDGKIAWMAIKEKDLIKYGIHPEDTYSFINHLLILDQVKVVLMFREYGDETKVSMRSLGSVDIGSFAKKLGGGGHNHSAAVVFKDSLESVQRIVMNKLNEELSFL